jgi:hypothetical protein
VTREHVPTLLQQLARAEGLLTRIVAAGGHEFAPLLEQLRAIPHQGLSPNLPAVVKRWLDEFPYYRDREGQHTPKRGKWRGVPSDQEIDAVWGALCEVYTWSQRAVFEPSAEQLRATAAATPVERHLDVGRHRLHFLKQEHGGGFVVDDGWYVPMGHGGTARSAPDLGPDYLLVSTEACTELRGSKGGLCVVNAKDYSWAPLSSSPVALASVRAEVGELYLAGNETPLRLEALAFVRCKRR